LKRKGIWNKKKKKKKAFEKKKKKKKTLVVKPKNFIPSRYYENPTFLSMAWTIYQALINITYFGVSFNESLNLKPIIAKISNKINCTD